MPHQTMIERVLRRTHLSAAADLAALVAEEARLIGARSCVLYLVDPEETALMPVPAPDAEGRGALAVQGTVAGRSYMASSIVEVPADDDGDGHRLWLPLLDGTERLGTMELGFGAEVVVDDELKLHSERYAHLVSVLVVSKGAYSDYFDRVQRRRPMSVASELIRSMTPPRVLATEDFILGAMLEPAYDMGGDAYDYALNEQLLHLAVFDAMGHGVQAAGVAALALATDRNARREGAALADRYDALDRTISQHFPGDRFVTAVLAELDVGSGSLRWLSAGHPAPLLLRAGRLVKPLDAVPLPPAGTGLAPRPPSVAAVSLQPGDMLLFYTDGLTEARRPGGKLFTTERLGEFVEREAASGQAAPETLRRLRHAIIGRGAGALHDDATALLVEWRRSTPAILPETVLE